VSYSIAESAEVAV
jgi:CheY-like chemotaxis protein